MKLLLSFILFCIMMPLIAQEKFTWEGKEYLMYPTQSSRPYKFKKKHTYFAEVGSQEYSNAEILPNFNPLPNGKYVMLYKAKNTKRKASEPACFFNLKNNLPEGFVYWLRPSKDTLATLNYQKGVKNGISIKYSTDGNPLYIRSYKNGLLHGSSTLYYWNSSKLRSEKIFRDNIRLPGMKYFDYKGVLYEEETVMDSMIITSHYFDTILKQRNYKSTENEWISNTQFYDNGQLKDSTYPSIHSYYYNSRELDDLFNQIVHLFKDANNFYYDNIRSDIYHNNGQKFGAIHLNYKSEYGSDFASGLVANGLYFDTLYNKDGSIHFILNEVSVSDSVRSLHFEKEVKIKKKTESYELDFINGVNVTSLKEIRNIKGNLELSEFNRHINYIDTLLNDTVLLSSKKIEGSYYKTFWVKDSVSRYFEGLNKYTNGQPKESIKGWLSDYTDVPFHIPIFHEIYTEKGLSIKKDSLNRISIGGIYLNGFYRLKYSDASLHINNKSWLNNSERYSNKSLIFPSRYGYKQKHSDGINIPISGYFKDGFQDSIWRYQYFQSKDKYYITFKEGLKNGSVKKRINQQDYDAYNYLLPIEQFHDKEYNIYDKKNKKAYSVLSSINNNRYKDATLSYILTPFGDTVYTSIYNRGTQIVKHYNQKGLISKVTTSNNIIENLDYRDSIVISSQTYSIPVNSYVGQFYKLDQENKVQLNFDFDKGIKIPSSYNSAFIIIEGKRSNIIPWSKYYYKGSLKYEGYQHSYKYESASSYFLQNTIYFPNESVHIKFFMDTVLNPKAWLIEYYETGQIKAEANQFNIESEQDCDNNTKLKFDYLPSNYWNREGKQTLTNGTGYVFFKDEGTPVYEGEMKDSLQVGIWKHYDGNGNLTELGNYINGEKDGVWYSGDLTHIHFLEECLDTDHPKYEERKAYLENQVNITTEIYKNGELIQAVRQSN
jgi:antitoxin component YwqK of YwqJK toxin-antitoxin module